MPSSTNFGRLLISIAFVPVTKREIPALAWAPTVATTSALYESVIVIPACFNSFAVSISVSRMLFAALTISGLSLTVSILLMFLLPLRTLTIKSFMNSLSFKFTSIFLSAENLCIINDEKPLVCQSYPLHIFGLIKPDPGKKIDIQYGDCPNAVIFERPDGGKKERYTALLKELLASYGQTLVGMLREEAATMIEAETLMSLSKLCDIYPEAINEQIIELIRSKTSIGLFAFLRGKHSKLSRESTKAIQGLYSLDVSCIESMLDLSEKAKANNGIA